MNKNTRWLLPLCIAAIAGVFLLQFFWIENYYYVNKSAFEKEINQVFDDAIKKEFSVRCDSIEDHAFHTLLDTSQYLLYSEYSANRKTMMTHIVDKSKPTDNFRSHPEIINGPATKDDQGPAKVRMAKSLAIEIRQNMEAHLVLFRTQKFGNYLLQQEAKYDFDTARLKLIFTGLLADKGIHVPYHFYLRSKEDTFNNSNVKSQLLANYSVITTTHATYQNNSTVHFVRAIFGNPFGYIITKMGLLFLASLMLILIVAFSLFYLLRSLLTEKKLSLIKNDFISNITHELKTPIATVSAAVESLSDFDVLDDPEKTKRYLSHSKKELQRLSALVDTILTSSLYENQQFDSNPERFEVDEVMSGIISNYKFGTEKPVVINYHNKTNITGLHADKILFSQTITNVIDNAIKYSVDAVTISINCTVNDGFFVIAVKDNGIGVLKKDIPYLFEKFYRVPTNKHKIKGHGLGLNYVKSIMERHKGWCRVESEYGAGTKISLAWPI